MSPGRWIRNRYAAAAAVLLATSTGAAFLATSREPPGLDAQLATLMRTTLERQSPAQHQHAGHQATAAEAPVVCGIRVYGHEPSSAETLDQVRTLYGFHLCGIAEPDRPWDVAVKLAGPVILDLATTPPGIQVVEATAQTSYIDRLHEMFPASYAQLAEKEALTDAEMRDTRRRYESAAGL